MWKDRNYNPRRGREPAGAAVTPIRVLVADDQRLMRKGLSVILAAEPDITVVAEAGDGREAISLVARYAPAVALLDIRMPSMDGLEAARQVMALHPATRVAHPHHLRRRRLRLRGTAGRVSAASSSRTPPPINW